MRKLTHTIQTNASSLGGISSQACEYEIHRLCQEQILKQRQRKAAHSCLLQVLTKFNE